MKLLKRLQNIRFRQTCSCHPHQFEGQTKSGEWFYVRLRHDQVTIGSGRSLDEAISNKYYREDFPHERFNEDEFRALFPGRKCLFMDQPDWRNDTA